MGPPCKSNTNGFSCAIQGSLTPTPLHHQGPSSSSAASSRKEQPPRTMPVSRLPAQAPIIIALLQVNPKPAAALTSARGPSRFRHCTVLIRSRILLCTQASWTVLVLVLCLHHHLWWRQEQKLSSAMPENQKLWCYGTQSVLSSPQCNSPSLARSPSMRGQDCSHAGL